MNVSYYRIPGFSWATWFVTFLVWCLLKLLLCLKKTLLNSSWLFHFVCVDWQVFVIPQDSVIVFLQTFPLAPVSSLSLHLFCLVRFCCCCLPFHALSFVFYLVWCSGWKVYPLLCHRRPCVLAAVVSEVWLLCLSVCTFTERPHASEQGWKTASSTAPLLSASRQILDMWLFLCPSVVLSSTFLQFSWLNCQLLIVYLSPKTEQHCTWKFWNT